MVTHGGYLRALAKGKFEDILQVGLTKQALDIGAWRKDHGLGPQPSIAIVSRTLDFPVPPSLRAPRAARAHHHGRQCSCGPRRVLARTRM
jgi:hypothetical protein